MIAGAYSRTVLVLLVLVQFCLAIPFSLLNRKAEEHSLQEGCALCQQLVGTVESSVNKDASESDVVAQLNAFCQKLPDLSKQCNQIISEYAPAIIQGVLNKATPQTACSAAGLCTPSNTISNIRKSLHPVFRKTPRDTN